MPFHVRAGWWEPLGGFRPRPPARAKGNQGSWVRVLITEYATPLLLVRTAVSNARCQKPDLSTAMLQVHWMLSPARPGVVSIVEQSREESRILSEKSREKSRNFRFEQSRCIQVTSFLTYICKILGLGHCCIGPHRYESSESSELRSMRPSPIKECKNKPENITWGV